MGCLRHCRGRNHVWKKRFVRRVVLLILLLSVAVWGEPTVEIEVLKEGRGPELQVGQEAQVGYSLTLESGKIIDQATALKPFAFEVGSNTVIRGFSQAVTGMKVGERRRVVVPPELGYGDKAAGPIPANSKLLFQIELYGIGPAEHDHNHDAAGHDGHDHEHETAGHEGHDHEQEAAGHEGHDHDDETAEHEGHDHSYEPAGHEGHNHGVDLTEAFQDEDFRAKRNARDITRPAMYEYLLREFYTKPWRAKDGYKKVGLSTLHVFGVLILLIAFSVAATRKGYLSK